MVGPETRSPTYADGQDVFMTPRAASDETSDIVHDDPVQWTAHHVAGGVLFAPESGLGVFLEQGFEEKLERHGAHARAYGGLKSGARGQEVYDVDGIAIKAATTEEENADESGGPILSALTQARVNVTLQRGLRKLAAQDVAQTSTNPVCEYVGTHFVWSSDVHSPYWDSSARGRYVLAMELIENDNLDDDESVDGQRAAELAGQMYGACDTACTIMGVDPDAIMVDDNPGNMFLIPSVDGGGRLVKVDSFSRSADGVSKLLIGKPFVHTSFRSYFEDT